MFNYLGLRMSTLSARAVFGVNAPISQSFTRLRTLQKLGFGDLDFALGPVLVSFAFLAPVVFFVPVPFGLGAGVLSRVAGTAKLIRDMLRTMISIKVLIQLMNTELFT